MHVSAADLRDLTGYVRPSRQVAWLRANGWRFTVNALGEPKVAVAEHNRKMVGGTRSNKEPNWSALNGPQTSAQQALAARDEP